MIKVNGIEVTKGCTVKFRCGGDAVVKDLSSHINGYSLKIFLEGYADDEHLIYYNTGKFINDENNPLDIIEVIPPAFDWKDAKVGMAFDGHETRRGEGLRVWYVAPNPVDSMRHIFTTKGYGFWHWTIEEAKKKLTRAPEHDIIEEQDQ